MIVNIDYTINFILYIDHFCIQMIKFDKTINVHYIRLSFVYARNKNDGAYALCYHPRRAASVPIVV